jgi:hypothetical protein
MLACSVGVKRLLLLPFKVRDCIVASDRRDELDALDLRELL